MRLLLPRSEDQLKTANGRGADPIKSHVEAQGLKATALIVTYYGNPNQYNAIFEANKPMLKTPELIYPGQMLRIPT